MHSDPAAVKQTIRKYLMVGAALFVGTVLTVGANQIHMTSVALAITVALIIASVKGSLVAAVFMHLSDEKKWIYGALVLTVAFFIVLMFVPLLTLSDTIGKPINAPAPVHAAPAEHH